MDFVGRSHDAFVNLNPGDSLSFRFPFTTLGRIQIEAHYAGELTDLPGDHPNNEGADNSTSRIKSSKYSFDINRPLARDDGTIGDPGGGTPGGTTGRANEIKIELLYADNLEKSALGFLAHEPVHESEAWVLRVTRVVDGSLERRRYRIHAGYPSILPVAKTLIPMRFLQNGFDSNWNDGRNYIADVDIYENKVTYRWDDEFAALHGLAQDNEFKFDLSKTYHGVTFTATLPHIKLDDQGMNLGIGVDYYPVTFPGFAPRKAPYISIRLMLHCVGSRVVDITGPDNITLPEKFWVEIRLYLAAGYGSMGYSAEVKTSLSLEAHILVVKTGLDERLKDFAEKIYDKQVKPEGGNYFDDYLHTWLVGYSDVLDFDIDGDNLETDNIVVSYEGKPVVRPQEIGQPSSVDLGHLPILFADADDEKWAFLSSIPNPQGPLNHPLTATLGNLHKIDHIIVLMQENRSFDQVLGYLSRECGFTDVEGLEPGDSGRDRNTYNGHIFKSAPAEFTSWPYTVDSPCHSHDCVVRQISQGMKSFVADFAERLGPNAAIDDLQRIMDYYGDGKLPAYDALARQFAICDHWFSSHIGGTLPNRHITFSGALNLDRYGQAEEDNSDFKGYAPSEQMTFFDHLTKHNVTWSLFEHGYSFLRLYRKYIFDDKQVIPFGSADVADSFEDLAARGALPAVSFIEPDYIELPDGNDDHAPADMMSGQKLVARVARAVINSPLWSRSMLIITYDEHGGFYDHVFPPEQAQREDGTSSPIPPLRNSINRLGPRVPAFVISPFVPAKPGGINLSKLTFEHASIPATILRRFTAPAAAGPDTVFHPPKLSPRTDAANDLRSLLTLDQPRQVGEFLDLLDQLNVVANMDVPPASPRANIPTRKLPMSADPEALKEDFHGFMAYASSITGRRPS